jgi:hypothetical protein
VDRPKSCLVDVFRVDYLSNLTVICCYEVLFSLVPLLSLLFRERLPESSKSYMWLRSTFLSYPTTFLTFQRPLSSCLLAIVEVVDIPKSYQVDVFSVDYLSHQTITCGYEVLFYLISLLSFLVRELYHLVSLPQ